MSQGWPDEGPRPTISQLNPAISQTYAIDSPTKAYACVDESHLSSETFEGKLRGNASKFNENIRRISFRLDDWTKKVEGKLVQLLFLAIAEQLLCHLSMGSQQVPPSKCRIPL